MTDKVQKILEDVKRLCNAGLRNSTILKKDVLNTILAVVNDFKEEPVSNDLEEAALMHFKDAMEFEVKTGLKMAHITSFKAGAKWQKENLWKDAQGDDLPEYDREVVVFIQNFPNDAGIMTVAIGHRPNPEGWDGKSLSTGEVEHYTPKTYDKGEWNIPDVKYWLDAVPPKEIEL